MTRLDRYLLARFLVLFGFFSLVLVSVYWINRAVVLFDQLIADGHSAGVFVEFTALTLPNVIRLVLPVSAFAATVYAANRMRSDSELLVMRAAGVSPWRMTRPALWFGALVALAVLALANAVVPASQRSLAARAAALAEDVTAGLLADGAFLHPADGTAFYVRDISPEGELRDIFLADARDPSRRSTYTARRAVLVRTDGGPQLAMFDGMVQSLLPAAPGGDARLSILRFDDFVFDLAALLEMPSAAQRRLREVGTVELLRASPALRDETGQPRPALRFEAHQRIAQGAIALVVPLMAMAAMLLGAHSRFGAWWQIGLAVAALAAVELVGNAVVAPARSDAALVALAYLPALLAAALAAAFLVAATRPDLFTRRRRMPA